MKEIASYYNPAKKIKYEGPEERFEYFSKKIKNDFKNISSKIYAINDDYVDYYVKKINEMPNLLASRYLYSPEYDLKSLEWNNYIIVDKISTTELLSCCRKDIDNYVDNFIKNAKKHLIEKAIKEETYGFYEETFSDFTRTELRYIRNCILNEVKNCGMEYKVARGYDTKQIKLGLKWG